MTLKAITVDLEVDEVGETVEESPGVYIGVNETKPAKFTLNGTDLDNDDVSGTWTVSFSNPDDPNDPHPISAWLTVPGDDGRRDRCRRHNVCRGHVGIREHQSARQRFNAE